MVAEMRTLLSIITSHWHTAGNIGEPSIEFIRTWRAANIEYGRNPLGTLFASGSSLQLGYLSPLKSATKEWQRRHPGAGFPQNGDAEFEGLILEFGEREEATRPGGRRMDDPGLAPFHE